MEEFVFVVVLENIKMTNGEPEVEDYVILDFEPKDFKEAYMIASGYKITKGEQVSVWKCADNDEKYVPVSKTVVKTMVKYEKE